MTKKHYEAIADCIEFRLCAKDNHPHEIAKRLADYFQTDNPKFDRARFLQACGIESNKDQCPKYNERVLPDEYGKCSLCGLHDS